MPCMLEPVLELLHEVGEGAVEGLAPAPDLQKIAP